MAIEFDGANDEIQYIVDSSLGTTGDLTILCRLYVFDKTYGTETSTNPVGHVFLSHAWPGEEQVQNAVYWLGLLENSTDTAKLVCGHEASTGLNYSIVPNIPLNKNAWYSIAVIRDVTAKTYTVYVDDIGTTTDGVYEVNPDGGTDGRFSLGALTAQPTKCKCRLQDVHIVHNKVPEEVIAAYLAGMNGPIPGEVGWWDLISARRELKEDLIAWYDLDEASGTRYDTHINGYDLTDNNTVGQAAGKIGSAASFVAANSEYLSLADNPDFSIGSSPWTFVCWVYLDSSTSMGVACKGPNGGFGGYEWTLSIDGNINAQARIQNGVDDFVAISAVNFGALSTGTWYMLHIRYDGIKFEVGVNTVTNNIDYIAGGWDSNLEFRLGDGYADYGYMNGRIDLAAFWKRALTDEELVWLYNNGSARQYNEETYITDWDGIAFGKGDYFPDRSGNGRDLKVYAGVPTAKASEARWFMGDWVYPIIAAISKAVSGALSFAGTINRATIKSTQGAISPFGDATKEVQKTITSVLSFMGDVASAFTHYLSMFGSLVLSGAVQTASIFKRAVSGDISLSGSLISRIVEIIKAFIKLCLKPEGKIKLDNNPSAVIQLSDEPEGTTEHK